MGWSWLRLGIALAAGLAASAPGQMGYVVSAGSSLDRCETSTGWIISAGGSIVVDTARRMEGAASLKITSKPNWDVYAVRPASLAWSNVGTLRFRLYVEQPVLAGDGLVAAIHLTANGFGSYFVAETQRLHAGWNTIALSKLDFTGAVGNPSWSTTMSKVRFYFKNRLGGPIVVNLDDVVVGEKTRPKLIFSFDDNYLEHFAIAFPCLKNRAIKGTAYVIGSKLDASGRFTTAQANQMYEAGWDMCNHTMTHPDLTQLSAAQMQAELANCRALLIAKGWTRGAAYEHVAYPYGAFSTPVLSKVGELGMATGRTVFRQRQANELDERYMLTVDIPDWDFDRNPDVFARIDRLIAAGGVLQICFHRLVPGTPKNSNEWNVQDFYEIVDYVAAKRSAGLLDTVTVSEWYAGLKPITLSSFTISPTSVVGGVSSVGTVSLSGPAPSGGVSVNLSTPDPIAEPPSSVTIPGGQTGVSFSIKTYPIDDTTSYTLKASYGGIAKTAPITLLEEGVPTLAGFTISPAAVTGGAPATGKVTLSAATPTAIWVTLASPDPIASPPTAVKIPAGLSAASFTIQTYPITVQTTYAISASYAQVTKAAAITLKPVGIDLYSLTINPSAVVGGAKATGTVDLTAPAATGGMAVAISESSAVLSTSSSVTVTQGQMQGTFQITTYPIAVTTTYTVTSKMGSVTKTATITVKGG